MNFAIRPATTTDVPAMHDLRIRVRENRLSTPDQVSQAAYLSHVKASSIWVAEANIGVVGFAAPDGAARRVWALFVDPDVEQNGIGRALHQRMLEWAREQGFERLSLGTEAGTRAAQFYGRAGWKQAGVTPDGELAFTLVLSSWRPLAT